jgi:uncharacterized repeat protein (TIGR02543 family)
MDGRHTFWGLCAGPKNEKELKRAYKRLALLIITTAIIAAATYPAAAATYYLDAVSGDDSNLGTEAEPWQTLTKAFQTVTYGDTVKLHAGNYGQISNPVSFPVFSGSMTEPLPDSWEANEITFETYGDGTPIITRLDFGGDGKSSYTPYVFNGITFDGSSHSDSIVHFNGCVGVTIKNCTVHGTSSNERGIFIEKYNNKSNNFLIENCHVYNVGDAVSANCSNITVKDCDFGPVSEDHILFDGGVLPGIYNCVVEGCLLHGFNGPDGAHPDTVVFYKAHNNTVRNNIFGPELESGIVFYSGEGQSTDTTIENNLFYDFNKNVLIRDEGTGNGILIRNNTFVGSWGVNILYSQNVTCYNNIFCCDMSSATGIVYSNYNIYFDNDAFCIGEPDSYKFTDEASMKTALFNNPNDNDYTLKADCLGIGFTDPVYAATITDLLGNTRDASPDTGCYEFVGSVPIYTISASAGQGGTISPTGEIVVGEGNNRTFTIMAYTGYHIDNVLVDSVSQGAVSSYSFTNVSADHTISANFGVSPTHTITADAGDGGSISPAGDVIVTEENNQTFTINPDLGYVINDVLVDGISQGAVSSYTFISVTSDHTIEAVFDISDPNDALVGYWKFDEGSGTTAQDASGNSNTATLVNGPVWTAGRINGGLSFDGGNDAVQIGTSGLNTSSGAVALWAYAESFASSTKFLFGHATQPWANRIQLYTDDTSGNLGLGLGDTHSKATDIQQLAANTWYHIALTWNENEYVVYVDGIAKANGSYTGFSALESYADIGNNGDASDRSEGFDGVIDEVRIYNRALSATEVQAIYDQAGGTPTTYTLGITAQNGSVSKDPDKTGYDAGETVTLQATPNTGYHFTGWSGDASGTTNPVSITMNSNKSVTAGFAINTYTLNVTATHGSVTKTPNKSTYNHGETVSLQATPNTGYHFTGWSGDASGTSNPVIITMNADKSVTANFGQDTDDTAPTVTGLSPDDDAVQVPLNNLVQMLLVDNGSGVDADTVNITLNGNLIYTGDTSSYQSATGRCYRLGSNNNYTFVYQADEPFDFDQLVQLAVSASDAAGNPVSQSWSFRIQMRSFGANKSITAQTGSDREVTATASDSSGNIWVVWHEGQIGSRNIRLAKLVDGGESFNGYVDLTNDSYDQCNADITIDDDDKLYVVWQGDNSGSWDIYISTSTNGSAWSAQRQVTNSGDDEVNPAIAVDGSEPANAYVVWEDDRNGNGDIYAATSSNDFQSSNLWSIATEQSEQSEPAITVDADDTVYVVWTDDRQGTQDIYGASSDDGPWTNHPVISRSYNQSSPALAAEDSGSNLHLLWVDDRGSDYDIYYAQTTDGIPVSPVDGQNIVDDTTNSDQLAPAIAVIGSTGIGLCVFACWQDERNSDTDLYFAQVNSGSGTNIFVGDGSTNSNQSAPALGLDDYGYPYVVWTDDRNDNLDIFYAASTYMDPQTLVQQQVSPGSGAQVGPGQNDIEKVDDVSVNIPAGACPHSVNVKISKMQNMPSFSQCIPVANYDVGPSGITFNNPVTIIIPYNAVEFPFTLIPYCYEPQGDTPSQNGITAIEQLSSDDLRSAPSGIQAISFQTTHFSQFFLAAEPGDDEQNVTWRFGTYEDQKNAKVEITDGDGNPVVLSLRGDGYGEVTQDQDSVSIELHDTTDRTSLVISAKDRQTGGTIGDITVNGSLNQISSKGIDLEGDITISGSLAKVTFNNVCDSIITIGSASNPRSGLSLKFARVRDSSISSQTPICSLTVSDWSDTDAIADSITAPSISSLKISGDRRNNVNGDFQADLVLTAASNSPLKAMISGDLTGSNWSVDGDIRTLVVKGAADNTYVCCTGSILKITLGAAYDSDFLAGFEADFDEEGPDEVSDFLTTSAQIKSFTVKGIKTQPGQYYFINSNVSAPSIGRVKLVNLKTQNSGNNFGISVMDTNAGNDLASVSNKSTMDKDNSFTVKQGDGIPGVIEDFCMEILQP